MEIFEEFCCLKGHKIRLQCREGEYEGVVRSLSVLTKKIIMDRVILLPDRKILGSLNFFAYEIMSYTVLEKPKEPSPQQRKITAAQALRPHKEACTYRVTNKPNNQLDADDDEYDDDMFLEVTEENEEEYVLRLPEKLKEELPKVSQVVDEMNDDFTAAIENMKQQTCIGVYCEGKSLGRFGELYWIVISTRTTVFLFDICSLKMAAFKKGLKDVLEDKNIEKAIHDCRQVSDILYHQYGVDLVNIFDTQVADIFIRTRDNRNGKCVKNTQALSLCLLRYLDIDQEYLPAATKQSCIQQYAYRPIKNRFRDQMIKNTAYLIKLKTALQQEMLSSFTSAVNLYLGVLRNCSIQELDLQPSVPELVPQAFFMSRLKTVEFQSPTSAVFQNTIKNNEQSQRIIYGVDDYVKYVENCTTLFAKNHRKVPPVTATDFNSQETNGGEMSKDPGRVRHCKQEKRNIPAETENTEKVLNCETHVANVTTETSTPLFKNKEEKQIRTAPSFNPSMYTRSIVNVANIENLSPNSSLEEEDDKDDEQEICWPKDESKRFSSKIRFLPAGISLDNPHRKKVK